MKIWGNATVLVRVPPVDVEIIDDDRVAAAVRRDGQFEPESLAAWGKLCEGGMKVVIDVGSYGGVFGIAARLMKNEVLALEPKPIMVRRTRANAALNGVNYPVLPLAASDKDGEAELGFNPDNALTPNSSLERIGPARMTVRTVRLDSLKIELPFGPVRAIKIDVEGHEAAVIRGALTLIDKHKPTLIVETLDDEKRRAQVCALLPAYEHSVFLDGRNMLMVPREC